ncbi:hypothetical protein VIGAN_08106600 [Vigna angularis var. angularis]|uniref:Uncharacterized protein n=1 Tax=Vigna angularis var. angularis TaxID=157739 RepID=A0A0S3SNM0_PHAAN|nr:hypothetical protein VIGAN_08106600 [Vigna angularis var. angularis]
MFRTAFQIYLFLTNLHPNMHLIANVMFLFLSCNHISTLMLSTLSIGFACMLCILHLANLFISPSISCTPFHSIHILSISFVIFGINHNFVHRKSI